MKTPANLHEFIAKNVGDDDYAPNGDTTNGKEPNGATNGGDTNGPLDEKVNKGDGDNDADDDNPGGLDTDGDDQGRPQSATPQGPPPKKKDVKPDGNINSDPNALNMSMHKDCGGMYKGGICKACGMKQDLMKSDGEADDDLAKGIPGATATPDKTDDISEGGSGNAEGSRVDLNAEADIEASDHAVKGLHGWLRKADDEEMAGDDVPSPQDQKLDEDAEQNFEKGYLASIEPYSIFALTKAYGANLLKAMGPFIGPHGGKWADPAHKVPWSDKKHAGKTAPTAKPHDEHGAEDLHLTAMNESALHGQHEIIRANLVNKMASGVYDHAQATKLYGSMMDRASRGPGGKGASQHDVPTRNAAAKEAADQFADEAKHGEHDRLLNKKNAAKVAKHKMSNPEGNAYTAGGIHEKSAKMAAEKHSGDKAKFESTMSSYGEGGSKRRADEKAKTGGIPLDEHGMPALGEEAHADTAARAKRMTGDAEAASKRANNAPNIEPGSGISAKGQTAQNHETAAEFHAQAAKEHGKAFASAPGRTSAEMHRKQIEVHIAKRDEHNAKSGVKKSLHGVLDDLIKGTGEGTRGGKVVGHDASGKPIYESAQHPGGIHPGVHQVLKDIDAGKGPGMGGEHHETAMKQGLMKKNPNGQMRLSPKGREALADANLGRTGSGKPIASGREFERRGIGSPSYGVHGEEAKAKFDKMHEGWTAQDHKDAAKAHDNAKTFESKGSENAKDRHYAMFSAHRRAADAMVAPITEKSMSNAKDLHSYLAKATGIPYASDSSGGDSPNDDLPKAAPAQTQGTDVNGELSQAGAGGGSVGESRAQGGVSGGSGVWEGGAQGNAVGPIKGPARVGATSDTGGTDKLSEDDPDMGKMDDTMGMQGKSPESAGNRLASGGSPDGAAMGAGAKERTQLGDNRTGSGNEAMDLSKAQRFQGDQADQNVRLHDAGVAWRNQQTNEVTLPPNAARAPPRAAAPHGPKVTTTFQKGGLVAYSDASDLAVEEMMKAAQGGFSVPISQVGIAGSPMMKSVLCPHCGAHGSAMVTSCTHCGFDRITMAKSAPVSRPLPLRLQRAMVEPDIYLPLKR